MFRMQKSILNSKENFSIRSFLATRSDAKEIRQFECSDEIGKYREQKFPLQYFILIALCFNLSLVVAQSAKSYVYKGNKAYEEGNFEEAETLYNEALTKEKTPEESSFNLGAAQFRNKKYKEAATSFEQWASTAKNKEEKSEAYFNLGNSKMAEQDLEGGVEAYKKALINNPKNEAARYNLSYALKMMKNQKNKDKDDKKEEPSEFAKRLKKQADDLCDQGSFSEALSLMQNGLQKDKTVSTYNDFIAKLDKVSKIDLGQ
jgi:tetratricopeptide (TPR) repeat protein